MSRYIDADALIGRWCGMKCGCERDECGREIEPCIVVMAIEEAPTIDAVEVVRGEWIDRSDGIEGAWNYCSVCGEQAIDLYDFCPNCGAKMDGEREGE